MKMPDEMATGSVKPMIAAELNPHVEGDLDCKAILARIAYHDMMDEIMVSNKYIDYAVALEKEGKSEMANIFAEMAYEEFTHAHIQKDMLLKHGYSMTEEGEEAYHDLKERFKHTFR